MIRVREIRQRTTLREAGFVTVAADLVSTVWNVGCALVDWLMLRLPCWRQPRGLAFIVHPPNEYHMFTPFPLIRYLPAERSLWLTKHTPPCRLGRLTVRGADGSSSGGRLYCVFVAPEHVMADGTPYHVTREEAVEGVKRGVELARRWGARTIGMGAYLPPITRQGLLLADDPRFADVCLTTGHACTTLIIRQYLYAIAADVGIDLGHETVAIVGGAGSTGTSVACLLARDGHVKRLLLVDLPRKQQALTALADELGAETATSLDVLPDASVIIALTTAPGSILLPEHIGSSAVIIDDSKPRNTDEGILGPLIDEGRLLVLDVLAEVPGLEVTFHYDLDLDRPEATYTCLAEVFALHATGWRDGHYSIGDVGIDRVDDLAKRAQALRIRPAAYTSFNRPLPAAQLARFKASRVPGCAPSAAVW